MEQELIYKNIAVIGLGAAGGFFSVLAVKNPYNIVTGFDIKNPFTTLLPTGGGRCNITYDENDIKEFVKNYPRGDKFLISIFSKLSQAKTRDLFKDLGIQTYVQNDKRVFPISNSSEKTVKILSHHLETPNFIHKKEKVLSVTPLNNVFQIITDKNKYIFNYVVIASGGKGIDVINKIGHNIIPLKPSLTAFDIMEKEFYSLAGLSFKNVRITAKIGKKKYIVFGDLLFTHKSISGPAVFKISALTAYENISVENPLKLFIKLSDCLMEDIEKELKLNPKKTIKNVFSKFAPESFISQILKLNGINEIKQSAQIKKSEKEILFKAITELELNVQSRIKNSEIVTAGGIDLNEINPKTLESKLYSNLFFIGEILNIDGFTGGFNLQNCWSTSFVCSLNFNF